MCYGTKRNSKERPPEAIIKIAERTRQTDTEITTEREYSRIERKKARVRLAFPILYMDSGYFGTTCQSTAGQIQ